MSVKNISLYLKKEKGITDGENTDNEKKRIKKDKNIGTNRDEKINGS